MRARLGLRPPKIGVWDRGTMGMGYVLRNSFECFCIVLAPEFKRQFANVTDVWREKWIPSDREGVHSAEKPVQLFQRAITLLTRPGGMVLDPFMGIGTSGVAARLAGRFYIGIERDEEYFQHAQKRHVELLQKQQSVR